MSTTYIYNARLVYPGRQISPGRMLLHNGRISAIDPAPTDIPGDAARIDAGGKLLTPGLIDIHTHGMGNHRFERSPEELLQGLALVARYGTTSLLPSLARVMKEDKALSRLELLSKALASVKGAAAPGWHLEGPFLKLPGAGAPTISGDLALLDDILSATGGRTLAMSISPDTPNIMPVIERLVEKSIIPFITHTQASVEQTERAVDAGARHATHFYDVFPIPDVTDPGVRPCGAVEVILADPRCTVDFIGDGVHVHPVAIRAALAAKGFANIVLITDSNVGAGMPAGIYDAGPIQVRVAAPFGPARLHDPSHPMHGSLAGSGLTMNVGMANLHRWLKLPPEQIWAMGTINPARLMGLKGKGDIAIGADADIVIWNEDFTPVRTWVAGELVYSAT